MRRRAQVVSFLVGVALCGAPRAVADPRDDEPVRLYDADRVPGVVPILVMRSGEAPAPRWTDDPKTIGACARTTRDRAACVRAVERAPTNPVPLIEACARTFRSSPRRLACLAHAGEATFDASRAIVTCGRVMARRVDDTLACIGLASRALSDPAGTIEARARSHGRRGALAWLELAFGD